MSSFGPQTWSCDSRGERGGWDPILSDIKKKSPNVKIGTPKMVLSKGNYNRKTNKSGHTSFSTLRVLGFNLRTETDTLDLILGRRAGLS